MHKRTYALAIAIIATLYGDSAAAHAVLVSRAGLSNCRAADLRDGNLLLVRASLLRLCS
jgi:hypothetical protein